MNWNLGLILGAIVSTSGRKLYKQYQHLPSSLKNLYPCPEADRHNLDPLIVVHQPSEGFKPFDICSILYLSIDSHRMQVFLFPRLCGSTT